MLHPDDLTLLAERSFDESNIPPYFRVVFPISRSEYGPQGTVGQLIAHQLDGVRGISDTGQITWQYLTPGSFRNAMLMMPGPKTVALNKLTRVMYDNPHYLISKNCAALQRIWQRSSGEECQQNLFDGAVRTLSSMKTGLPVWAPYLVAAAQYSNPDWKLRKACTGKSWNTVKELATLWQPGIKAWVEDTGKSKANEFISKMTIQDWMQVIELGCKAAKATYGDEGEWIVKDKVLRVPKGSRLTLVTPQVIPDDVMAIHRENPKRLEFSTWTDVFKDWAFHDEAVAKLKQAGYQVFPVAPKNLHKGYQQETEKRMRRLSQPQATA